MSVLRGKTALVTGGASGIGLAAAKLFAANGAQVIITARTQPALDAAVAEIGDRTLAIQGDVSDLAHHEQVAQDIRRRFGGLDIYFANAGVIVIRPSSEVGIDEFDAQFAINVRGVFFGVQKVAPLLRHGGSIILTSSIASSKVLDGHAVYAGSKAAIEAFARSWALEFKHRGIRVNVLSPGPVDTPIISKMGVSESERPLFDTALAKAIPLGRLGQPEELGRAALFLASDASSFVTGATLRVDGGISLA
ncbi:glucose 1-dehydrogenase [Bradyrhizobium sp. CER78]|uniref:SDR family NAD(P)-dependent oxidoreductase n=1 Tax=Bradyrhizobium sp. CER78 TaxID=3039162 RepID=UPI002448C191|nr:glucose 1-dehydrogenase [Bradyrhizobium sp. CER78]MDH2384498.1 SDR family oxidoreductase [Bradyrhizobium sp. CER78]